MYDFETLGRTTFPWTELTPEAFDKICDRNEVQLDIRDQKELALVVANLFYDKREVGHHGRCVAENMTFLRVGDAGKEVRVNIPKGARLEATMYRRVLPFANLIWPAWDICMGSGSYCFNASQQEK